MEFLKVQNIQKRYHSNKGEIEAIKDISFTVNSGEYISILGPSGCGKST
ncbi:MAG: ATP-binding cassette domain-containing protein, partial [Clostridium sp.]